MNLDVDFLIDFFNKYSSVDDSKEEMGEQDAAPAAASPAPSSGGGGGSIPKWADVYGFKQGKANPKTAGSPKWETGLTRGLANQIW